MRVWWPILAWPMFGYNPDRDGDDPLAPEGFWRRLQELDIDCTNILTSNCDLVFSAGTGLGGLDWERKYGQYPHIPVCEYSWDLYDNQVEGGLNSPDPASRDFWERHIERLKRCAKILVPSNWCKKPVWKRTRVSTSTVLSGVRLFHEAELESQYVFDPIRPLDKDVGIAKRLCDNHGIPCVHGKTSLGRPEYRKTVANCRFMVTTATQASTGGLSLLEGYALGKPVLLTNSPTSGIIDYFGKEGERPGVYYYQWDNHDNLLHKLKHLWHNCPKLDADECRAWVESRYGGPALAERLAKEFYEVERKS